MNALIKLHVEPEGSGRVVEVDASRGSVDITYRRVYAEGGLVFTLSPAEFDNYWRARHPTQAAPQEK